MNNGCLLWADDEIDLLKAHIIFLEHKGYTVTPTTNGADALDLCRENNFDLILLDENMPGLSGLETLLKIKEIRPNVPVVMITKSEEENIMEQAIGSKIADYLIKPVNPNQILLTLKKNIHKRELINEVTQSGYQQEFGDLGILINDSLTFEDWKEVYRRLVYWELELSEADSNMDELLVMQKQEANNAFSKYIKKNYEEWINNPKSRPIISPDIFKTKIFPILDKKEKVFLIVLDNFRYDQWRVLQKELTEDYNFEEDLYCSILPTATQYARNAIFAGLMPLQIQKMFPDLWIDEDEEGSKNANEEKLIATQMQRYRRKEHFSYHKILDSENLEHINDHLSDLYGNELNVLVINFIDILSHTRTESKMVRELASNEAAYRSITLSWFKHTAIRTLFKLLADTNYNVIVTTDHGSIRVESPTKVKGGHEVTTNLRYKLGRNMEYNPKEIYEAYNPQNIQLPSPNLTTAYIFAIKNNFFAYPNNYNYYVSYFKDTFQHGGISMEEMLIPLITLKSKK